MSDTNIKFNSEDSYLRLEVWALDDPEVTRNDILITNVSEIRITTDLVEYLPTIEFRFLDPYSHLMNKYKNNTTCCQLTYYKDSSDTSIYEGKFIITEIKLNGKDNSSSEYIVRGVHYNTPSRFSRTPYSTANTPKPYSQILCDILASTFKNFKEVDTNFINSYVNGHYITPISNTNNDTIEYLLDMSHNDNAGLYFLKYTMIEDSITLLHTAKIFDLTAETPEYSSLNITTAEGTDTEPRTAFDIKTHCFYKPGKYFEQAQKAKLTSFDHTTRKWSSNTFSMSRQQDILQPGRYNEDLTQNVPNIGEVHKDISNDNKYDYILPPKQYGKLMGILYTQLLTNNVISFSTLGHISRNAGERFELRVEDNLSPLHNKFAGIYLTSRVTHIFKPIKQQYINDIVVIRNNEEFADGIPYTP